MTKYELLKSMSIEELAWEIIVLVSAARLVAMGMPKDEAISAVNAMKGTLKAQELVKQGVTALQKEVDDESEVQNDDKRRQNPSDDG